MILFFYGLIQNRFERFAQVLGIQLVESRAVRIWSGQPHLPLYGDFKKGLFFRPFA